jgi:hypothetical protein
MAFRHRETSFHRLQQCRFLIRPRGGLLFFRPIRLLKSSLTQIRPIPFFECPKCRKCVRMAFGHNETSLHRLHQNLILRRPEGRLWFFRANRL